MNDNIRLHNNVTIKINPGGVLSLNQKEDSATKGGILLGTQNPLQVTSYIDNSGVIDRRVKDDRDTADNKVHLKIEPLVAVRNKGTVRMVEHSSLEFKNDIRIDNGGRFDGTKSRVNTPAGSKFSSNGTVDLSGTALAGLFEGDVEITGGDVIVASAAPSAAEVTGNYTQSGGTWAVDLGGGAGAVGGVDYDQLVVAGGGNAATLGGALSVALLPGFAAPVGSVFTIIHNQTDQTAITTTFAGLPNNSTFTVGGWTFRINYDAQVSGDPYPSANDVTLTVVATPYSISGTAWSDLNGNGVQDAGESGVAGVTVYLFDGAGNLLASAVTDASGNYSFANLAPGTYRLQFVPPAQYPGAAFAPKDVGGDDTLDSDVDPLGYTDFFVLAPDHQWFDRDAGLLGIPA